MDIFSQEIDFRDYFSHPPEMDNFYWDYTVDGIANVIFEKYFREQVIEKAKDIQDIMSVEIKGILLSPITPVIRDNLLIAMRPNPNGEVLIGASYLV